MKLSNIYIISIDSFVFNWFGLCTVCLVNYSLTHLLARFIFVPQEFQQCLSFVTCANKAIELINSYWAQEWEWERDRNSVSVRVCNAWLNLFKPLMFQMFLTWHTTTNGMRLLFKTILILIYVDNTQDDERGASAITIVHMFSFTIHNSQCITKYETIRLTSVPELFANV